MQPLIQSLKVNNLLSFGPDSPAIELGRLNVIIGANGSGKSNLFDVLALLKHSLGRFYQFFSEYRCPIEEWQWKSTDIDIQSVTAVINVEGQAWFPLTEKSPSAFSHLLNLEFHPINGNVALSIIKNTITIDGKSAEWPSMDYAPNYTNNKDLHIYLSHQHGFPASPLFDQIYQLSTCYEKGIFLYDSWVYGRKSPLRDIQSTNISDQWLFEDGRNLCVVLKKIKNNEESYSRYLDFLKQLYEGVDRFDIVELDDLISFRLIEGKRIIRAARLSDGTLRYLMLMAVLCDPEPPPVVCIEEPEMGLHPDLILSVAEALEFAAERTQVIVTTHSDRLVDYFTHSPEVIQVCEKHEGQTYIERLDPEELKPWLEKYSLGEYWSRGGIGGNRW